MRVGHDIELESRIRSVVVFRQGARVERVAELAVGGGASPRRARLANLPLALDDASVRLSIVEPPGDDGADPTPLIATSFRVTLDVGTLDPKLTQPDDAELRDARLEEASLAARQQVLRGRRARLDRLELRDRPRPKRGEAPGASPTSARLALVDFAAETAGALDAEIAELVLALMRATERREGLEERARRASSARDPRAHELKKCIEIELEGGDATRTEVELRVEYAVPGATWAPAYAVHLDHGLAQASIALRAQVSQRTGEDWTGAHVTCSTAAAQSWSELPELPSLRIGRYQAEPARTGFREAPSGAEELYADLDRTLRPRPTPQHAAGQLEEGADDEVTGEFAATASLGGAPPPAAAAPPRPAAPPLAKSRARLAPPASRSAPMPPAMPAPQAALPRSAPEGSAAAPMSMRASYGPARSGPSGVTSERDEVTDLFAIDDSLDAVSASPPPDPLLDYPSLRVRGYEAADRGRLVVADVEELYLEHVAIERRVKWAVIVRRTIAAAYEQAHRLAAPPQRHWIPQASSYDYAYRSLTPVDIPSDGEFHSIPLSSASGPSHAHFVVVPRESNDVFRVVELDNPFDSPLLPGPADIYLGERYLMTSDVADTPPGGTLRLGLGVEQRIKVARNASFTEETRGLMRGSLELAHDVRMEIVSHLPAPARIEVRERLPVTRDDEEQIKIIVDAIDPAWEPYEQEGAPVRGGHRWWVDVAPGGRSDLRMAYTIRIASKSELVGGNRRER